MILSLAENLLNTFFETHSQLQYLEFRSSSQKDILKFLPHFITKVAAIFFLVNIRWVIVKWLLLEWMLQHMVRHFVTHKQVQADKRHPI